MSAQALSVYIRKKGKILAQAVEQVKQCSLAGKTGLLFRPFFHSGQFQGGHMNFVFFSHFFCCCFFFFYYNRKVRKEVEYRGHRYTSSNRCPSECLQERETLLDSYKLLCTQVNENVVLLYSEKKQNQLICKLGQETLPSAVI